MSDVSNTCPHTSQYDPAVFPASSHVASLASMFFTVCFPATTSCATNTNPHSEQCFPSVKPFVVHVAFTAASTTSVCPKAGIVSVYVSLQ